MHLYVPAFVCPQDFIKARKRVEIRRVHLKGLTHKHLSALSASCTITQFLQRFTHMQGSNCGGAPDDNCSISNSCNTVGSRSLSRSQLIVLCSHMFEST